MVNGHNGQAHSPPTSVTLKLLSVPEKGPIIVRFLGELQATMVHWIPSKPKGHSEVCLGENCEATLHKRKISWKGYAPVEVWRPADEDWYPGVLEVTEAFGHQLEGRRLLGEQWEVQRCRGQFKHDEVVGTFLTADRPPPVDTSNWVEAVCFRLYRTTEILWGAVDPLPNRMTIVTRKAPPPAKAALEEAPPKNSPVAASKSLKELTQEAKKLFPASK